jgi:hypothetical protein
MTGARTPDFAKENSLVNVTILQQRTIAALAIWFFKVPPVSNRRTSLRRLQSTLQCWIGRQFCVE